jgi:hypothetical protein
LSSTTPAKRLRRIQRRAIPEVVAALEAGQISVRMADTLLYLPPGQQRAQLERRLAAARERQRKSQLVAQTIRRYLDSAQQIDLAALRDLIQAALSGSAIAQ